MSRAGLSDEACASLLSRLAGALRRGSSQLPADAETMARCLERGAAALGPAPGSGTEAEAEAAPAAVDPAAPHTLMADGGSRGNPGPAGAGAVILDDQGREVRALSRFLQTATNNVAEYQGLIMGLEAAVELGLTNLTVKLDSELLVKQLKGQYKVKAPHLQPLFARAKALLQRLGQANIMHVRREFNQRADALANQAMDRGR